MRLYKMFIDGSFAGRPWTSVSETEASSPPEQPLISLIYPNPFNSETRFMIALPEPAPLQVAVYDITGRRVAMLGDESMLAKGVHRIPWNAEGLSSGTYIVRASTGKGQVKAQKVTLVK